MANLQSFKEDEQLLLILVCNQEALFNKVVELTGCDHSDVEKSLGIQTGEYIRSLTDDELKEILDTHRHNQTMARQLANKVSRGKRN